MAMRKSEQLSSVNPRNNFLSRAKRYPGIYTLCRFLGADFLSAFSRTGSSANVILGNSGRHSVGTDKIYL